MYSNEQSFIASAFWVFILKAFSCTKVKEAVTHVSLQYFYSFIFFSFAFRSLIHVEFVPYMVWDMILILSFPKWLPSGTCNIY